jgi:NitT/TauT family transport system permease protein
MSEIATWIKHDGGTERINQAKKILWSSGALVIFLLAWEILPRLGVVDPTFLPPFSVVLDALVQLFVTGEIWDDIIISLMRAGVAFIAAVIVGITLGLLMGWFRLFEAFIDPLLQTIRQIPILALYPVFILLLGIGEVSKIAIIFKGALWPILLATISGVRNVDTTLIKSARSMGVTSEKDIFRKVVLPSAIPEIMVGIRLSATTCVVVLVAAEMLGAKSGLGFMIVNSEYTFQIPKMYAGIIIITVLGLALNYGLVAIERKLFAWKEDMNTSMMAQL